MNHIHDSVLIFCVSVCMFLKICARLKSIPEVVFFFTRVKFIGKSHIYMKLPAYARVYMLTHPLCGPPLSG